MKYLLTLILILSTIKAQDTTFVSQNNDTLHYYWEAYEELPFKAKDLNIYNNNIFLTYIHENHNKTYYSDDFLKTWHKITWVDADDTITVVDYCVLPNKKIVLAGNYYYTKDVFLKGDFIRSGIKIYDFENATWETYFDDDFKHHKTNHIVFKNQNLGLLATNDSLSTGSLYKTTNGGKDWNRIYKFSENTFVTYAEYFEKDDVILLVLTYFEGVNKKRYLMFSEDFGKNWTELRDYPISYEIYQGHTGSEDFYIKNDSIWTVGAVNNGLSKNGIDIYNYIMFSPNMGKSWKTLYRFIPPTISYFSDIEFFDDSPIGIICERNTSRFLITFDYGENWRIMGDPKFQNATYKNPLDNGEYNKLHGLFKADNKMVVTSDYGIYVMNYLDMHITTGVDEKYKNTIFNVYFDNMNQIINFNSADGRIIDRVELYTASGQKLYSVNNLNRTYCQIQANEINYSKRVFAIIYSGNQMFMKKILCE